MSITLSSLASLSIGGIAIESDANSALTYIELTSFPRSVRLFFSFGATTGQLFAAGPTIPKVIVTVDLVTGVWTSSNGLSGTLGAAGLQALQTVTLNLRNGLENFAVNQNIVAGTFVAWTQ
jgi:hypothetical protein